MKTPYPPPQNQAPISIFFACLQWHSRREVTDGFPHQIAAPLETAPRCSFGHVAARPSDSAASPNIPPRRGWKRTKAPRRSPQARADRGEPDSRVVRAGVPRPPGADSPPQSHSAPRTTSRSTQARRRLPGRRSPRHPFTARDRPAARSRRVADRPEAIRRPRRACGHAVAGRGRNSAGRHARRPQGPRRPVRPRSGRALQAQTANVRTPVCGQNPKEPRRRAAGAPGTPNRQFDESARRPQWQAVERRGIPPPPGCGAGRIRRADFPTRIAVAASCGRGRPIAAPRRAEHDSRPPSPAPPIRFTAD